MKVSFVLIILFSSFFFAYQTNVLSNMKAKSLIQTSIKLRTLTSYLNEYSELEISLNEISDYNTLYAYFNKTSKVISIHPQQNDEYGQMVAKGKYEKTRFKTGWDKFSSKTFNSSNPIIQCYAVGIIEGLLSYEEIYDYRHNFEYFFSNVDEERNKEIRLIKEFFNQSDSYIKNKINSIDTPQSNSRTDQIKEIAYLSCIHAQINGLHQGYSLKAPSDKKLDLADLYLLNSEGYYSGIQNFLKVKGATFQSPNAFFNEKTLVQFYNTSHIEEIWKKLIKRSHCSAIIKLMENSNGESDIFLGHNTWTGYNELLRTLKKVKYAFEGNDEVIGMKPIKMKYSSYPGILFSGDEFYTIGKNLAITQTSLSIINAYQYKNAIIPETYIPEFMRIMTINFISKTGKEWVDNYINLYKNNHIYEAQWIVIDYNNLKSPSGLMYIVEEVPKSVQFLDYTTELRKNSYYGSFNVPFFRTPHADIAGLYSFNQVDFYNKKYNPRQYILDKFQGRVKNLEDFKNLLMYNGYHIKQADFPDDPSYNDSSNGLASREGDSNGAIDFKIVNHEMMEKEQIWVYSGPVYQSNENFKPFDITQANNYLKKYLLGMPKVWNFKPFIFS